MQSYDVKTPLGILNSITAVFALVALGLVLKFGPTFELWQTRRGMADEAQYLRSVGVTPSPAMDMIYWRVRSCYVDTAGFTGPEPPSVCADATTGVLISTFRQEDQRQAQKLLAKMNSDVR